MKNFFERMKGAYCISSILCILLGIVMIVWGENMLLAIGRFLGAVLVVTGAVNLVSFFFNGMHNGFSATLSAVVLLIGVWVLANPGVVASIVPIVIGVILLGHGVKELMVAMESRQYGYKRWGIGVLLAILSILFGVFCVINAFGLMKLTFTLIGAALICNGISNIWVASRAVKSEKTYRRQQEIIDVEFKDE